MKYEIVTADDIAERLKVTRRSAVHRLYRLQQKHKAIRLDSPYAQVVCRYKLLVPMEELFATQKYRKPPMDPTIDWGKFCSDPFRLTKEVEE